MKKISLLSFMLLCAVQLGMAQNQICTLMSTAITSGCPSPTPTPFPTPTPTPAPTAGFIQPKYKILAVTYAPPGQKSTVSYVNTNMMSNSLSLMETLTSQNSISVSDGFKTDSLFGILPSIGITSTFTETFTQEQDTTTSIALVQSTSFSKTIPGPASSAVGLDHDADVIWIWLNPVLTFSKAFNGAITWTGFGYDGRDPVAGMDILGVQVGFLNGHTAIPSDIAAVLARTWGPTNTDGSGPGLTSTDLANILAADPFSNPSYTINMLPGSTCTVDGRFCTTTNENLQYSPPPAGDQPITNGYSWTKQTTVSQGQGASETFSESFSTDLNASGGFFASFTLDVKSSTMITLMDKFNALSTNQVGQTITASVTGPATTDNYTGPVEFDIFQDNIYGTFMFGFIPPPTFSIAASPSSQTIIQGNCGDFTVATTALVSPFTSSVALKAINVPANVTDSISPASITGAGSSTVQVCTTTGTPTGSYSFLVSGTTGIETHDATISFTVSPPPNFSISASPTSRTVDRGLGTSYTISTTALNGFNGVISLSLTGVPSGASASLSSGSITGTGSATLSVSTSSTMAVGTYTITITGDSGSLQHSTSVTLFVTVPPPPPPPCPMSAPAGSSTNIEECPPTTPAN